MRSCTYLPI
jgi:5'-3' exoribonuclease 1